MRSVERSCHRCTWGYSVGCVSRPLRRAAKLGGGTVLSGKRPAPSFCDHMWSHFVVLVQWFSISLHWVVTGTRSICLQATGKHATHALRFVVRVVGRRRCLSRCPFCALPLLALFPRHSSWFSPLVVLEVFVLVR